MTVLRIAFILPALADFILAGLTLMRMAGIEDESIVPRLQFSGVAFAWGVLLLFALARPIERAWILLPTGLAVAGVLTAICAGYSAGVVSGLTAILALLAGAVIYCFGFFGLRFSRQVAVNADPEAAP